MQKNKILIILNYYVPYISGVTEYARLAAEMLVEKGYHVDVLASNHANLPSREVINGVHVYRARVLLRISKGVLSTEFIRLARMLSRKADIVNMHLPMLESGLISLMVDKNKLITMYQCDVNLPPSLLNRVITKTMDISHSICLGRSKYITVTSIDYAEHSRVAAKYKDKLIGLTGPIKNYHRIAVHRDNKQVVIGFCGRIVEEKGIDVLIKAFEVIKQKMPQTVLKIAGDYKGVAGGSIYPSLKKYIESHNIKDVTFLGKLKEEEMSSFFSGLDVFVLPSINSLEAYGMVQVEAMECGTPVVASDLYGVRTIVKNTGAGLISKARDYEDLANCIMRVLNNREFYVNKLIHLSDYYSNSLWEKRYIDALIR